MSDDVNHYWGKDCPNGMVQIEFVGARAEKNGEYGWKPGESAFLEVYVDGIRFRIDVGNVTDHRDGTTRRGLHIIGPCDLEINHCGLNALDIYVPVKDTA